MLRAVIFPTGNIVKISSEGRFYNRYKHKQQQGRKYEYFEHTDRLYRSKVEGKICR